MFETVASRFFLSRAQKSLFLQGIPVLAYHGVERPPSGAREPFLFTPPRVFSMQMEELRTAGFRSGLLDDLAGAIPEGNPERKIIITFDDGCRSVVENAMEPLRRNGFRAVQFLVTREIGGSNSWDTRHGEVTVPLMDAGQVREWIAEGHGIGSHSLTHPNLARREPGEVRRELCDSRKALEDAFGVPVRNFAYPHGRWNESVRALVHEAGYETACTMDFGVNSQATPRHALRRVTPLTAPEAVAKGFHVLRRRLRRLVQ